MEKRYKDYYKHTINSIIGVAEYQELTYEILKEIANQFYNFPNSDRGEFWKGNMKLETAQKHAECVNNKENRKKFLQSYLVPSYEKVIGWEEDIRTLGSLKDVLNRI